MFKIHVEFGNANKYFAEVSTREIAKSTFTKFCALASVNVGTDNPPVFATLSNPEGDIIDHFTWV